MTSQHISKFLQYLDGIYPISHSIWKKREIEWEIAWDIKPITNVSECAVFLPWDVQCEILSEMKWAMYMRCSAHISYDSCTNDPIHVQLQKRSMYKSYQTCTNHRIFFNISLHNIQYISRTISLTQILRDVNGLYISTFFQIQWDVGYIPVRCWKKTRCPILPWDVAEIFARYNEMLGA